MLKRYKDTILTSMEMEEILLFALYGYHCYERELKNSQRAEFHRETHKHKKRSKEYKDAKLQEEVCTKDMVEHRCQAESLEQAISAYRQIAFTKMWHELKKKQSDESNTDQYTIL